MRAASLPDVKSLLRNTEALEILIETLKLYKYWQNWVFPPFTLKRLNYFCLCFPEKKKFACGKDSLWSFTVQIVKMESNYK